MHVNRGPDDLFGQVVQPLRFRMHASERCKSMADRFAHRFWPVSRGARDPAPVGTQILRASTSASFAFFAYSAVFFARRSLDRDRKSTRLNSSHANISYAVF